MITVGRSCLRVLVDEGFGRGGNKKNLHKQIEEGHNLAFNFGTGRIEARANISPDNANRYWVLHIPDVTEREMVKEIERRFRIQHPTEKDVRDAEEAKRKRAMTYPSRRSFDHSDVMDIYGG